MCLSRKIPGNPTVNWDGTTKNEPNYDHQASGNFILKHHLASTVMFSPRITLAISGAINVIWRGHHLYIVPL